MLLTLLFAFATAPVMPEPVDAPAIIVSTTRLTDAEINKGAGDYVRSVLPTPTYGQYARWADPVCAKVTGIEDSYAALVMARVMAAADAAGVKRGKPGCRPNLSIVFSEDAATTVKAIVRKKPGLVSGLSGPERARLLGNPLPVRSWHVIELRGSDGRAAAPDASGALMSAQSGGGTPLGNVLPGSAAQTSSWSSSLIDTHVAVWATRAVVVVDVTLAAGKPLDAVGDYVAMVALAPMRLPPPAPGVTSILGLFTGQQSSSELSEWDRAFLKSLYRIRMNRSGFQQRGLLVGGIKAELAK